METELDGLPGFELKGDGNGDLNEATLNSRLKMKLELVRVKRITNSLIALFALLFTYAFLQWLIPGGVFS